ncbi:MAG: uracil-DNA glycosylase family protein [Campylobacterota bacterium]|nr:uracil-DNA glycosylase family protein [Campylobacterota bacterium]
MTIDKKTKILDILNDYKLLGFDFLNEINCVNKIEDLVFSLPNTIEELEQYINHCSLCDNYKQKIQYSNSVGDIYSEIYIVTIEKISSKELMDKLLSVFNTNNKVCFTPIIKCEIPKTINSKSSDIAICKSYIQKQIEIVRPKYILALGDAFKLFFDNSYDIVDISGNLYNYQGIKISPVLDPSFVNKNPSYENKFEEDLVKIKSSWKI